MATGKRKKQELFCLSFSKLASPSLFSRSKLWEHAVLLVNGHIEISIPFSDLFFVLPLFCIIERIILGFGYM